MLGGGGGCRGVSQNHNSTDTVHCTCTCMRLSSSSIASCVRFRVGGGVRVRNNDIASMVIASLRLNGGGGGGGGWENY